MYIKGDNGAVSNIGPGGLPAFAPAIVVGNQLAGDTPNTCDFLDTGNGAQLAAAITAAGSTKDVWIRPGTYDLKSVGAPATPISVQTNVRGAGQALVTIASKSSGDQGVFALGTSGASPTIAELSDVTISVRNPAAATAGSTAVLQVAAAKVARVTIAFDQWSAAGAALATLRFAVDAAMDDSDVEDVAVTLIPSLRGYAVAADMVAFQGATLSGIGPVGSFTRCSTRQATAGDCTTKGTADVAFQITSAANIGLHDCEAWNARVTAFFIHGTNAAELTNCRAYFANTLVPTGMIGFKLQATNTICQRNRLTDCFANASGLVGTIGYSLVADLVSEGGAATVQHNTLSGNVATFCVTGFKLSATNGGIVDKNTVIGSQIDNYTTAIAQTGDTNTDLGHNQS